MALQTIISTLISSIIAYVVYSELVVPWRQARKLSLPPGPSGHWLFGNAPPGPQPHRYYAELVNTYGPVISLRYGKRIVCVIGRYQAAVDILSKHSAETTDRPRSVAANEMLSGGKRVLMTHAGERLKTIRKAFHGFLQPTMAATYKPMQTRYAKQYILNCLHDPEHHLEHAKQYAASVVMSISYAKKAPTSYQDPEIQAVNKCLARLAATMRPGAHLVDTYPFLKYMPGYLSHFKRWYQEELGLYTKQVDIVRKQMAKGGVLPSFTAYLLENQSRLGFNDEEVAYITGAVFGAGSDTSASALGVVTMAAACYPEAQAKVQVQLDKIIGRDRAPTFQDEDMLPEVVAFVLESFRWRPVSVGGFPHRATKDIIWKDYVIPAGAEIFGIHWAISRDPDVYPDPENFNPQRWLTEDGRIREDLKFPNFGFGRRVCVGQHVADNSLFINTALILWAFNISQDPSHPIDTFAFTDAANTHPLPFKALLKPRVPNLEGLLGIQDEQD